MAAIKIARMLKTNISFFDVSAHVLQDKNFGESQKLVNALCRVTNNSAPVLLCVVEVGFNLF